MGNSANIPRKRPSAARIDLSGYEHCRVRYRTPCRCTFGKHEKGRHPDLRLAAFAVATQGASVSYFFGVQIARPLALAANAALSEGDRLARPDMTPMPILHFTK